MPPLRRTWLSDDSARATFRDIGVNGRAQRTPACGKGLVFSLESFLQDQLVERQLGHGLLQPIVLAFEILQALGLVELQAAILAPPAIVALLRDADASASNSPSNSSRVATVLSLSLRMAALSSVTSIPICASGSRGWRD